jgi:hypothetical protein
MMRWGSKEGSVKNVGVPTTEHRPPFDKHRPAGE